MPIAISKEKAIEAATKAHKKEMKKWNKRTEEAMEEMGKEILRRERETPDHELTKQDVKYVAGNAPAAPPMWVVSFKIIGFEELLSKKPGSTI